MKHGGVVHAEVAHKHRLERQTSSPSPARVDRLLTIDNRFKQRWALRAKGKAAATPLLESFLFPSEQCNSGICIDALAVIRDLQGPFGIFFFEAELVDHRVDSLVDGVEDLRSVENMVRGRWWRWR